MMLNSRSLAASIETPSVALRSTENSSPPSRATMLWSPANGLSRLASSSRMASPMA